MGMVMLVFALVLVVVVVVVGYVCGGERGRVVCSVCSVPTVTITI